MKVLKKQYYIVDENNSEEIVKKDSNSENIVKTECDAADLVRNKEIIALETNEDIVQVNKSDSITNKITIKEKEDIYYNDRFYEDYRPTMRKTIAFTGNNFSDPAVQACATLIISGSVKRGEKIKPNDYYKYFESLYGVVNIRKLHIWLYENDYLRNATPKEALTLYKVDELKNNIG